MLTGWKRNFANIKYWEIFTDWPKLLDCHGKEYVLCDVLEVSYVLDLTLKQGYNFDPNGR